MDENALEKKPLIYPVSTDGILYLKNMNRVNMISIYGLNGRKIMDKNIIDSKLDVHLDVSSICNGSHIMILKGDRIIQSEMIIISL